MNKVYNFLLVFTAILFLSSCKKDEKIAIDNLNGKWSVTNDEPNLAVDGSITYTFNPDKTCVKNIYDALMNSNTSLHRIYVVSNDNTLVTLYDEDKIYTEQYRITKLTSKEMKWENASPGDGNTDKRLIRY